MSSTIVPFHPAGQICKTKAAQSGNNVVNYDVIFVLPWRNRIMLHRLFQPKVLVFFVLGALIGGILFSLGNADDAPGLSLIGLTAAFLLMMRGIYHAKILRQGCHIPLVLMIYGVFGLTFPFVLFFDGEIRFFSPVTLISFAAGAAMLAIAVRCLRKNPNA